MKGGSFMVLVEQLRRAIQDRSKQIAKRERKLEIAKREPIKNAHLISKLQIDLSSLRKANRVDEARRQSLINEGLLKKRAELQERHSALKVLIDSRSVTTQ